MTALKYTIRGIVWAALTITVGAVAYTACVTVAVW